MLFSFFHNFVTLRIFSLFSRLISFFPIFNRVMKNEKLQKVTYRSPTLTHTTVRCPLTRERGGRGGGGFRGQLEGGGVVRSVRWGMGVHGGGVHWGGG